MKSCKSECYVDDSKLLLSFAVSDLETAKDLILSDLEREYVTGALIMSYY